jgi:hypothetical protein
VNRNATRRSRCIVKRGCFVGARDSSVARAYFLDTLMKEPNSVPMRQVLATMAEQTDPGEALRLCEEVRRLAAVASGAR